MSTAEFFPLHSLVRVKNTTDDYGGCIGRVRGYETNLLGKPLIVVDIQKPDGHNAIGLCFYASELYRLSDESEQ